MKWRKIFCDLGFGRTCNRVRSNSVGKESTGCFGTLRSGRRLRGGARGRLDV